MSVTVLEQNAEPKVVTHGPGYVERLGAESRLARIATAVDAIAVNPKTGTQRPVKIKMHHGAIVEAGRENAIRAIERGDAELLADQSEPKPGIFSRKK